MPLRLVSLGSSFAAGPGIRPVSNSAASRSANNYPSLLAIKLSAELTDLTVSGATLLNVLSVAQNSFPPQITLIPDNADIITLTAGGNDVGFIAGLIGDSIKAGWIGWAAWVCASLFIKAAVPITEDDLVIRLHQVVVAIHLKAPNAKILLVEYLSVLAQHTSYGPQCPLSSDQIGRHLEVQAMVNNAMRTVAKSHEAVAVVSISNLSCEHAVGSVEPWVNGFTWNMIPSRVAPWHPNRRGMEAVAQFIYESLQ